MRDGRKRIWLSRDCAVPAALRFSNDALPSAEALGYHVSRLQRWRLGKGGKEEMNREADKSERRPQQNRSGWPEFFDLVDQMEVPDGFLLDRGDAPPQNRDLY
jgi:hypothetical protein